QTLLGEQPSLGGETSRRATGSEDPVARNGDEERVAPQRLSDGARCARFSQHRGDLAVACRAPGRQRADLFVDGALEGSEDREIDWQGGEVLRLAREMPLQQAHSVLHEFRDVISVLAAELRAELARRP